MRHITTGDMVANLVISGFEVTFKPDHGGNRFRVNATHPERGQFSALENEPEQALSTLYFDVTCCPECGKRMRTPVKCPDREHCKWVAGV